jgi:DNA invertase Pin-like site-specific DNA recombinase
MSRGQNSPSVLKALNAGDVLIVWKLDRLGRSLRDLIGLLDDLETRGVVFLIRHSA